MTTRGVVVASGTDSVGNVALAPACPALRAVADNCRSVSSGESDPVGPSRPPPADTLRRSTALIKAPCGAQMADFFQGISLRKVSPISCRKTVTYVSPPCNLARAHKKGWNGIPAPRVFYLATRCAINQHVLCSRTPEVYPTRRSRFAWRCPKCRPWLCPGRRASTCSRLPNP